MKGVISLIMYLTILGSYAQDTIVVKTRPKNYLSAGLVPSLNGIISGYKFWNPVFTTSLNLEYTRVLTKKIWITIGTGIFVTGYNVSRRDNSNDWDPDPNFEFSLFTCYLPVQIKPKFIVLDKKLIVYLGLSYSANFYLTNYSVLKVYDVDNKLINNKTGFDDRYDDKTTLYYSSGFAGIGIRFKKMLLIAEPEFKILTNTIFDKNVIGIPYAVGLSLSGYYNF